MAYRYYATNARFGSSRFPGSSSSKTVWHWHATLAANYYRTNPRRRHLSTCWVVVLSAPGLASGSADGMHFRPTGYNVSTNSMVHLAVDPAAANGVGLTRRVACE